MLLLILIEELSNSPILQRVCPHVFALASYTGIDKILKNIVGLHAKAFVVTKTKYYARDYFNINRSVMNVNCYYNVYFSVKSFYPHFSVL